MTTNGTGNGHSERWDGIERVYTSEDVSKLRGTVDIEHTLARLGAERLWNLLRERDYLPTLGAVTGNQAVQMVKAGLEGIYVSGWQVAADANLAGATYPDQSLYPANSVPAHVRRINNALLRADQITTAEGDASTHWIVPIVADAEAGFGGPLNAFELMKAMIEAGAAGVHFEDQLASEKKCGHLGGKVLVPTNQFVRTLNAARLAADVCGVPTVLIARTDALSAKLVTSDADPADEGFLTGERTAEGFFRVRDGLEAAIARSLAYAPYADIVWFETSTPDLGEAREFAQAIHEEFPGKLLAYNCSPSFNWRAHLDDETIASFQQQLAELNYRFQFVTLAGFHSLNSAMFELARAYAAEGMSAYVARAGAGVRAGGGRVHRGAPPARGRRRVLRPGGLGGQPGDVLHARARGIDGVGPISSLTDSEHGTKADEIALALEDAIVSGEIPPGAVLRQEQLSEQFEVSRTPVREALRRLAATGLVSFVPNRGVRVREISRGELREAFLIRAELEALATELATPLIDDAGLAALEEAEATLRRGDDGAPRPLPTRERAPAADGRVDARELRLSRRHLRGGPRAYGRARRQERAAHVPQPVAARRTRDRRALRAECPPAPCHPRCDRGAQRSRRPRGRARARPPLVPHARADPRSRRALETSCKSQ